MMITAKELSELRSVTIRAIQKKAKALGISKTNGRYVFTPEQADLINRRISSENETNESEQSKANEPFDLSISGLNEPINEHEANNQRLDFVLDEPSEHENEQHANNTHQENEIDELTDNELDNFQQHMIGYGDKVDDLKNMLQKSRVYQSELQSIIKTLDETVERVEGLSKCETRTTYISI